MDTDKENVDAELAAVEVARALGMHGVYPAERNAKQDNVIILGQAGQNLKLKALPKNFNQRVEGFAARDLVENGNVNQLFNMMVLDAVIHNNDRHGQNFMIAKPENAGEDLKELRDMVLIVDNGLGQVIATKEGRHTRENGAVEYITRGPGANRASALYNVMLNALGPKAVYEMMQISTQQGIQALRRDYPVGSNPNIDKLVDRLEELQNADIAIWGG
jgi:hypothetical protein